jgi:hypothetical protein
MLIMSVFAVAVNASTENETETKTSSIKSSWDEKMEKYKEKYADYGNEAYATVACVLDMVRILSYPLCFLGIAISGIHQYIIGIRKLDTQEKGLNLMVTFITLLVICQILPIAFAIVVNFVRR